MTSREKTLAILGPTGAGKATLTGCMLFKYGGIDMVTMERFQKEGIRTYEEAAKNFKSINIAPQFDTPKHHVTVQYVSSSQADCAIVVLPVDDLAASTQFSEDVASSGKQVIVLLNKMDLIEWSEERFLEMVKQLGNELENIPIIPISALKGDNIVEKSSKASWYTGWKKAGKSGMTLLDALDVSLQS